MKANVTIATPCHPFLSDERLPQQYPDGFHDLEYAKPVSYTHLDVYKRQGGACLITYTNAIQNNRKIAQAAGVRPSNLKVNALGLISGMFYTAKFDKIGMFLPKYLYGKNYKNTSFCKYVNPENPELIEALAPAWLVTSHDDYLRNYTIHFEKALERAMKEHELVDFPKNDVYKRQGIQSAM